MIGPIISVAILTYNHESYLSQAIESVLEQKSNYPFEIIIHDDASSDGTPEIILNYAKQYPDIIIPIIQKENQWSKGLMIAPTFMFPQARGKYIATLEGDDYWTDPFKLQKQVSFLEEHPQYSGSAHQSLVKSASGQRLFKEGLKQDIPFERLLGDRIFHTASFVFRTDCIKKYPLPPKYMHSYDRLLFMLVGANGPIRYFNEPMCVYRQHDSNISAHTTYDLVKKDFATVPYLVENIPNFPKGRYLSFLHRVCILYPKLKPPLFVFLKHYFLFLLYSFANFPHNFQTIKWTTRALIEQRKSAVLPNNQGVRHT